MDTAQRTIVAAVLHSQDDCILMGKVREGGVYPDCWHIPGGGVEEGETKMQALIREIREEVGLDISGLSTKLLSDSDRGEATKIDKRTGKQVHVIMQFNVYEVELPQIAADIHVSLDDDLVEFAWVSRSHLSEYKLTPPSAKLFRSLGWINAQ